MKLERFINFIQTLLYDNKSLRRIFSEYKNISKLMKICSTFSLFIILFNRRDKVTFENNKIQFGENSLQKLKVEVIMIAKNLRKIIPFLYYFSRGNIDWKSKQEKIELFLHQKTMQYSQNLLFELSSNSVLFHFYLCYLLIYREE